MKWLSENWGYLGILLFGGIAAGFLIRDAEIFIDGARLLLEVGYPIFCGLVPSIFVIYLRQTKKIKGRSEIALLLFFLCLTFFIGSLMR